MENDGYLNTAHKNRIKYIEEHKKEIDKGSKILCAHIIRKIIRQLNDRYDILMITKEFECFSQQDKFINDIRRVCLDVSNDYYVLVSINKVNQLLEEYGISMENVTSSSRLNSLYISYCISRESLLDLISTKIKKRKKKYVRSL